ncbi:unnamed protein product [Heligmosomoides polygyrus]|uniref:ERAP1_C domain-containing protein n=1 Tax=Heligmosomoides polygyrus TaxID=6339 RepID=A0A183G4Z1_HELPZ|nr:unnamed protein product [Heligmosomoides polygyrus]
MISSLIGEETFKQSVTHYLKKFSYNNAQPSDLWTAFDDTVKDVPGPRGRRLKIAEFADQWTSQLRFPMVTAESVNAATLKISQRRYKTNEQSKEQEEYRHPKYGFKWDVPLWYQEGNDTEVKFVWLTRGEYSVRTRNAIISDAFAAAMISQLDYETVFRLLEYAKKEKEFLPWDEIIRGFSSVLKFFGNEPESKMAKNYMMSIMKPIYENSDIDFLATNYKSETLFFELILQQSVISTFCSFGSRDCLAKLKTLFDKEVMQKCKEGEPASQCANVAAPLRSMVYCYGVKEGGDAAFDKVMGMYKVEGVQLEKDHLLQALLLLTLDRNSSFVRFQDVHKVFDAVSANPVGEEFMFNFLIERWEEILESLPTEYRVVQWIISVCAAGIRSEQQIEQMRNLQKYGLRASDFGAFHEEIEKAQHKVEWIKKHFRKLADFFKQYTSL